MGFLLPIIMFICGLGFMVLFLIVVLTAIYWFSTREKRTIEVTTLHMEPYVMNEGTSYIWTIRHSDGKEEMVFNGPNPFVGKFLAGTMRIQHMYEEGAKYRLIVAGGKSFSEMGFFQNILHCEKIG